MSIAGMVLLLVLLMATSAVSKSPCPSYCECYSSRSRVVADCNSKMLSAIPAGLPVNVTTLRLGYNNITALRNLTLSGRGLSLLERLELNDNLLSTIEPGAFDPVSQLTRLDLENNNIRVLHPDTLRPLSHLWKLVLNGNPLQLPTDGPFLVAPDLQVLELEGCGIVRIPPLAFQNLSGLFTLRLTNNSLSRLSLSAPNLIHLAVGSNFLTHDSLELNTPALLQLDISQSGITRLPNDVLRTTPNIDRLRLENNFINTLELEILSEIQKLRILNLTGNLLTNLHADTFQGNGVLTHLDISANPLQFADDGGFISSNSIRVLSIASCNISLINANTFSGLPNITHLILNDNNLRTLSKITFSALTNLESLSVDGNRIHTIAVDFPTAFKNLISLSLSRNPLNIPSNDPFLESKSLKELVLNQCELDTVPTTSLRLLPNLTSLSLSTNQLTTLEVQTVQIVPDLNVLNIDGNPLNCDCALVPLWEWCSSRECENSIVRCRRPRNRMWHTLKNLVCVGDAVTEIMDTDLDFEVEMVDVSNLSRRPPERLSTNV